MTIQTLIEKKITDELKPFHLEVVNESHLHHVPPNSETHFRVVVVSDHFKGLSLRERQQRVYAILKDAMAQGVHALSQKTYTVEEWSQRTQDPAPSPQCLGGGRHKG